MVRLTKDGRLSADNTNEYVSDTLAELTGIDGEIPFGSLAFIVQTSENYMYASNGNWQKVDIGGVSKKYVDNAIQNATGGAGVINDGVTNTTSTWSSRKITDSIPTKTSDLNNDSNFIDGTALNGYATEVYVGQQIANIDKLTKEVTQTVPTVGTAQENVLYLVETAKVGTYEQYMLINGAIVDLGSTDIDLTDYATKTFVTDEIGKLVIPSIDDNATNATSVWSSQKTADTYSKKAQYLEGTLLAANWQGVTYSFENQYPVADYDIEISLNNTANLQQVIMFNDAMIVGSVTSNVVAAHGIVPTADIPIIIKAVMK